jgi:ATP-dependent phosphofructokinase / diphosphate-dependent phosphofructokinase
MNRLERIAVLAGGGPAPGINSVIGAATIRACLAGIEVLGINDGFYWLMQGDINHASALTIRNVAAIHFRGGVFIGISRANPARDDAQIARTLDSLDRLSVDAVITIGGDETALAAMRLSEAADGRIKFVHVPKTIDNDLALPDGIFTFGFQSARHVGVGIVKDLQVDAATTSRWYFIITMGRKSGHLALGIGKAAGVTLTIIPEEFRSPTVPLREVVDLLAGAIIKRRGYGRRDGVAILAEGVMERIDPADRELFSEKSLDPESNRRISEVRFGELLRAEVTRRLTEFGIDTTIVSKNIGYELRCADPIPFDMEYTRDLGYCASKYLLDGGTDAVISVQNGQFRPIPFQDLIDPATGSMRVRTVDIETEHYKIARRYMLRLRRDDFEEPLELEKLARVTRLSVDEFRQQFEYLVADEPAPLHFER